MSKAPRRPKKQAGSIAPEPKGEAGLHPHELRAGDVVLDERGDLWELLGRPTKSVGAQEFVTNMRRIDSQADVREGRWKAHERVRVKRA